jgi:hypothetical protein
LLDLHPLALEDVFHGHSQNRSKADYYTRHLFLRVLCHEIVDDNFQKATSEPNQISNIPRSASPEPMDIEYEKGDQLEDSGQFTVNGKLGGSLSKRGTLGSNPLLPTSRIDIKPAYPGNQEKMGGNLIRLISNEGAVGIISLFAFPFIFLHHFSS